MKSKPKVSWNTRLGGIGESEIKKRLLYFSNPTKYELDPGIDFYCELLEEDSPSIPFYIQAKGTEHFDDKWGQSIKKSTITYWLQQKFPVFLVVYDKNGKNCYWMSIEDYRYSLFEKIFKTDSNTIYIQVDRSHALEEDREKNNEFIKKIEEDLFSIELFRGHAQFKGRGYVKRIPDLPRSGVELVGIKENIRANMYALVCLYMQLKDWKEAYFYCKFLTKFDKHHYNHFVWFGLINELLGDHKIAKKNFEEALRICEADKEWPEESMKKIIASIKEKIESCE